MLKSNHLLFNMFQRLFDALLVSACWWLSFYLRFTYFPGQEGLWPLFLKLTPVIVILNQYQFHKNGLYASQRFNSRYFEIFTVIKANSLAILFFVISLYFFADERISRATIGLHFGISTLVLTIFRLIVRNLLRILRKRGHNLRHVLLVGDGAQLYNYIDTVFAFKDAGLKVIGWLDSPKDSNRFPEVKRLDGPLKKVQEELNPDAIVVSYAGQDQEKLENILKENYDSLADIQVLPDLTYSFIGHKIEDFAGIPLLSVNHPKLNGWETFLKRALDIFISGVGLIFISPLMFLLSLFTKLSSPGPIFYGQERIGLDGRNFMMWKFRTMKQAENNEDKNTWGSKGNPRITKLGSFLRKSSLDELPQLANVLFGNMSIVGPRPERPFFVDQFREDVPAYMLRHKMKAGITGWAQVNGWRGDTSIKKRIEFDIYYIKHWSIWFDIKIIFLTFIKGFLNKNAY